MHAVCIKDRLCSGTCVEEQWCHSCLYPGMVNYHPAQQTIKVSVLRGGVHVTLMIE